ncbi:MAG: hypothetical protein IKH21_04975 [Clostridia bacterium]|nr:hypothetical protein [Clostridia bacterium]
MERTIKSKRVSYGLVEIRDAGAVSPRYRLYVAGQLAEYSDNLSTIIDCYNRRY